MVVGVGVGGTVVGGGRGGGGDGANGIEVVGYEALFGNEDEEGEFLEDGDLGDFVDVDGAEPAAGIVAVGDEDADVGADGDHWVAVRLMESGGAVDAGAADGVWARLAGEASFDFFDGAVEGRAGDVDAFGDAGHDVVGECCVCYYSKAEGLCVLSEERSGMAGFGFDDFITPFLSALGGEGVKDVAFSLSEVLDAEWIEFFGFPGVFEDCVGDECLSGIEGGKGRCGAAGVDMGQSARTINI